jgi:hypothetical protein
LLDAIVVTDPELGSVTVRIGGQHLTYYPLEAVHELVLTCEGL